jgi:DNA-binding transcriptional MerR regulator
MTLTGDKKRSIGEAAREIGVPEHVLRFWEKEFGEYIQPTIGVGKRRYYYNNDMTILQSIKYYLREKGYTIKGLKNLFESGEIEIKNDENPSVKETNPIDVDRTTSTNTNVKFISPQPYKNVSVSPSGVSPDIKRDLNNLKHKMGKLYEKLKETCS